MDYDVIIVGAGPGGYVCGIRAAQLGLKVAVVEADKPGGVCLNWGCIPSKSLIHQASVYAQLQEAEAWGVKIDRSNFSYKKVYDTSRKASSMLTAGVQGLLKKNKISYLEDRGVVESATRVRLTKSKKSIEAKNIVIATGSRPRIIPGFEFDEQQILSSTGILSLQKLPKSIIILGAGVIGVEFAYVLSQFGVQVQMVELMDRILPTEDREFANMVEKSLTSKGVKIHCSMKALSTVKQKDHVKLLTEQDGKKGEFEAELMLVSVGRSPNTEELGLEKAKISTERGYIQVGDYYESTLKGVFAIGDVVAQSPQLAHVACKEGEIVAEYLAGKKTAPRVDNTTVPSVVYCEPQLAGFGLNEEKAKAEKRNYASYSFPYRGAGKSVAIAAPEGMVKILYDPKSKEILGAHIFGHDATELIHELLLARSSELLPEDIAMMMHAHPTLSEAVMEAARGIEGWAIHV